MIINQLDMTQVRGFKQALFQFKPGFNLLVGENGTGKSSVLWSLRVILSHILRSISFSKEAAINFVERDIANDAITEWPFLSATLEFILDESTAPTLIKYFSQKNRREFMKGEAGQPREQEVNTPDRYEFINSLPSSSKFKQQPMAVFYSAHRSIITQKSITRRRTVGGQAAAYVEALLERELRIDEAAKLWQKEVELKRSDGIPDRANKAIEQALPTFLEGFSNIRVEGGESPRFLIEKFGVTLDLAQLSDGERSLLAILMDLTRRLAQANPSLESPAQEAEAVVLIDEIDLHLHPRWQSTIVQKLTMAFPKCQFIATTHSPLIIGEVQPAGLILLTNEAGSINVLQEGLQGYGLDASYILEHLMGTRSRPAPSRVQISLVEDALEDGDLQKAQLHLNDLRELLHGDDDEVIRLQASINNLEALADEMDPEEE